MAAGMREREIGLIAKLMGGDRGLESDVIDQWKVLIYDSFCRDIISPLMNVGALRQRGITLHLLLTSDREPISDAPAIYFVRPTEANIDRISEDCARRLYRSFSIHFSTRVERALLERLAHNLASSGSVNLISNIFDEYLEVISLEPYLFTLNIRDSFVAYNDPDMNESAIRSHIASLTAGLLSAVRVLGVLPYIRASPSGPSQMLANEFCSALRESISPRAPTHSVFSECLVGDKSRPLLIIFDRNCDMIPPLLHTSTYQALIDDVLECKLNRVSVEVPSKESATVVKKRVYDLNTANDSFFHRYAFSSFPDVVEASEKELIEVSAKEDELKARPASSTTTVQPQGKDLKEAIESLPELLARKANLDMHTNLLHAVMKVIMARQIPSYFELEQAVVGAGRIVDKSAIIGLLRDSTKGSILDKARLLLIVSSVAFAEQGGGASKLLIEELDAAFLTGCEGISDEPDDVTPAGLLQAVSFARRLQSLQSSPVYAASGQSGAYLTSLFNNAQNQASSWVAKATQLFSKFSPMYITRIVDAFAEGRTCPEEESFTILDPKARAGEAVDRSLKFTDVIVFVIGGGCYAEYGNLQELVQQKVSGASSLRTVTYGCSELINGTSFFKQLDVLSKKAK